MRANPNIDELLCSFLDGELAPRQQTEVQRLVARDPDVAQRLRHLQNTKTLIGALPRAEAPDDMLEQIKFALERKTLLDEQPVSAATSAGVRHLMFRRLVAAAAMIALMAVLGAVVYQIVAPVPGAGVQPPVAGGARPPEVGGERPAVPATVVADAGFAGRLEIRAEAFAQVDAVIRSAIEQNGLSGLVASETDGDEKVYKLASTREGVNRLIASLGGIWHNFENAALHVERLDVPGAPVVVESITSDQAMKIIAQKSAGASVRTAQDYAVLNGMARSMPGREVLAMVGDDTSYARDLATIDDERVRLLGPGPAFDETLAPPEGEVNTNLTIVLLHTR